FCVEFERGEEVFRSKPRTVHFGAGARFAKREIEVDLQTEGQQEFELQLEGRGIDRLNIECFRYARFADEVKMAHRPADGAKLPVILYNAEVFTEAEYGYFEVLDPVNDTVDRCVIKFKR
ncbi:hypothetical protein OAU50_08780, partial [Planctomycetota bacterium]|nr:hypothetical protein [Planctomycetota bacterium]